MKAVTPTAENVSWDHAGFITVDDIIVGKVDDDGEIYTDADCVSEIQAECDIDDLRSAVSALIADSNSDCNYINENVAAWASGK